MAKTRRCKHCKQKNENFIVININSFCDYSCATKFAFKKSAVDRAKAAKKKHIEQKKAFRLNDKPLRAKEAQKAFNAFIRKRDEYIDCISCGKERKETAVSSGSNFHAGHFKTAGGFPELRFEELNCHKQCAYCNNHLSGNVAEYRKNLIDKIGIDKVEWLEGPHKSKKYTCEDLKAIELKYKAKLKELASYQ